MESILGAVLCLSPLLFVALGYFIGRYGSPIAIQLRRPRDRRQVVEAGEPDESERPAGLVPIRIYRGEE